MWNSDTDVSAFYFTSSTFFWETRGILMLVSGWWAWLSWERDVLEVRVRYCWSFSQVNFLLCHWYCDFYFVLPWHTSWRKDHGICVFEHFEVWTCLGIVNPSTNGVKLLSTSFYFLFLFFKFMLWSGLGGGFVIVISGGGGGLKRLCSFLAVCDSTRLCYLTPCSLSQKL